MIATCCRPTMARSVLSCSEKQATAAATKPLSVMVRAQKLDTAPAQHAAEHAVSQQQDDHRASAQQQQVAKQQQKAAAVAQCAAYPAVRLPSLFHEMQREMDAMSRAFGLPSMVDLDPFFAQPPAMLARMELPTMRVDVDVEEDDSGCTIKADVPGMSKESLKAKVLDGTLTISGERLQDHKQAPESEEGASSSTEKGAASKAPQPLRYERSYGSFSRSFSLPPNVDVEGIKAEAQDGVLTVTIPKVPEVKPQPKEIPVN